MLRLLVLVNGVALLGALVLATSRQDIVSRLIMISALLQPLLLSCLLLLYALNPLLRRLPYWHGVIAVLLLVVAVAVPVYLLSGTKGPKVDTKVESMQRLRKLFSSSPRLGSSR